MVSLTSISKVIHSAFFIFFSSMIFSQAAPALEIKVREQASIRGDKINLGDIAYFSSNGDERISFLRNIEISSSPAPGKVSRINEKLLVYKIGSAVSQYDDITFRVPENLFIRRTAQIIDSDKFKEIFSEFIMNNCPYDQDNILITRINVPGEIALPEGRLSWNIREKDHPIYIGNVSLILDLFVDEKLVRRLSISGVINIKREIVRSIRQMGKGDIIGREDLVLDNEESMYPDKNIFTDIDSILGKRAVRTIKAGSVITYGMVENPALVKRGNPVLIKAENDTIKITTKGKVLEDGCEGDHVKVVNISSGKEIYAIVKGPGLVEINF